MIVVQRAIPQPLIALAHRIMKQAPRNLKWSSLVWPPSTTVFQAPFALIVLTTFLIIITEKIPLHQKPKNILTNGLQYEKKGLFLMLFALL